MKNKMLEFFDKKDDLSLIVKKVKDKFSVKYNQITVLKGNAFLIETNDSKFFYDSKLDKHIKLK